ncbi:RfbB dTDP-D-glucose 4,6-dehydratase [Burkholderiales bacterium]
MLERSDHAETNAPPRVHLSGQRGESHYTSRMILVTGGAGFIGSNFVLDWLAAEEEPVVNLDALTYAGNAANLASLSGDARHTLVVGDICDTALVAELLETYQPRAIVHFAAESHVDRSIEGPQAFLRTNVEGTFSLLQATLAHWRSLTAGDQAAFRFLHVSTDEVYGSLGPSDPAFTETTPYAPNSPYSASKAASDHLVRAWHHTYGLPVLTTNCSNNYGPLQFPEKLIPLVITRALNREPLPIYGDGMNVRDWLYVGDHCAAIRRVLAAGTPGEVYNIGGWNERPNLEIVKTICAVLDELSPTTAKAAGGQHERLLHFVKDRPGHDRRYAIDATKIHQTLGWKPSETFETGIRKTVAWYLANAHWIESVQSGDYREWMTKQYGAAGQAAGESAAASKGSTRGSGAQAATGTPRARATATGATP